MPDFTIDCSDDVATVTAMNKSAQEYLKNEFGAESPFKTDTKAAIRMTNRLMDEGWIVVFI